jgi:uncharacterized membrane protein
LNKTLIKELTYSALTTTGMVTIMMSYNVILGTGFNTSAISIFLSQFIPVFVVAFLVQKFVVSHNAFALHKKIVSPQDPTIKYIAVMTLLMVTGMCLSMTMYATLTSVGTENDFWGHYFISVARNYPVALIAQGFVVGPIVRNLHAKIFDPKPQVVEDASEVFVEPVAAQAS